ncbi:MAG: hypothetical protein Q7R96_02830 [Nanoarchaeota archaeon]|nr:hypothetical protein [Nanoarchaeota archaeon]
MHTPSSTLVTEALTVDFTKTVFPELWNDVKHELQTMGTKDQAEAMFYAGAANMFYFLQDMLREMQTLEMMNEEEYYGSEY